MDQIENARKAIAELAAEGNSTAMAAIRTLWPEIKSALDAGAKRKDVVAKLNASGIQVTLSAFDSCVRRLREADVVQKTSQT